MDASDGELSPGSSARELPGGIRRVVYQTVACPDAGDCVAIIQGRVEHNWQVAEIEERDRGFLVRFRREEAITPHGPSQG